ncbi:MAG: ATP-binding protein [Myxococcota bacterium]|nr:ATP-binding protein [Myxococcota bacterium]
MSDDEAGRLHIPRSDALMALRNAIATQSLLLTGEPGCGKSGLLHSLANELERENCPLLFLRAEQLVENDAQQRATLRGLEHPLVEVLKNGFSESGIVIIDALDAVRDPNGDANIRRLLVAVKQLAPWRLLASIREFDLKHSDELRKAFRGEGVADFSSPDFKGVAHFHLGCFSVAELDLLLERQPKLRAFIEGGRLSPKARTIHASPFYLGLAAELLRHGLAAARLGDWDSPGLLLQRAWEIRVTKGCGSGVREATLRTICESMRKQRRLGISKATLKLDAAQLDAVGQLRQQGLLTSPRLCFGVRVADDDIEFVHHLWHDFAIAAVLIPSSVEELCTFLEADPRIPVFYRQSCLFALERLWDLDDSRQEFWQVAFRMKESPRLHTLSRILAPLLAVRRVEKVDDLVPLLDAIARSGEAQSVPGWVLQHLVLALRESDSVMPLWCEVADHLARQNKVQGQVEFALAHILDALPPASENEGPALLLSFNVACALLRAHVDKPVDQGWKWGYRIALTSLAHSSAVAPAECEELLGSLLAEERLATYPTDDLLILVDKLPEFRLTAPFRDQLLVRLCTQAFLRVPPSGMQTNGSQILSLSFQRADGWTALQDSLSESLPRCPALGAAALLECTCIVAQSLRWRPSEPPVIVGSFGIPPTSLVQDCAHVANEEAHDKLLKHFERTLEDQAASNNVTWLTELLSALFSRQTPTVVWCAVLRSGAKQLSLGTRLVAIFDCDASLAHLDYCTAGVELFVSLHQANVDRVRLESALLRLANSGRERPSWAWLENDAAVDRVLERLDGGTLELPATIELHKLRQPDRGRSALQSGQVVTPGFHSQTAEQRLRSIGIALETPADWALAELLDRLLEANRALEANRDTQHVDHGWELVRQDVSLLQQPPHRGTKLTEHVWSYIFAVSASIADHATWPASDERWEEMQQLFLRAANAAAPASDRDSDRPLPSGWGWPSPRLHAATGLLRLIECRGREDAAAAKALDTLVTDPARVVRRELSRHVWKLWYGDQPRLWHLLMCLAQKERSLDVLEALVSALDRLWGCDPEKVFAALDVTAARPEVIAAPTHELHTKLAKSLLFQWLRAGDVELEKRVEALIELCDTVRGTGLVPLLQTARFEGWLTHSPNEQRARTWCFFGRVLASAQRKLEPLRQLHSDAATGDETIRAEKCLRLIDAVASELYFASGAVDSQNGAAPPPAQLTRFWLESRTLFTALSTESQPHTTHRVVKALAFLMPCAPAESFVLATTAVRSSVPAGLARESLAERDVVALVERAFADHRTIFQTNEHFADACLEGLLAVLDAFVEEGWPSARRLTYRLEEIWR